MQRSERLIHHTNERSVAEAIAQGLKHRAVEVYRRGEHFIVQWIARTDDRSCR